MKLSPLDIRKHEFSRRFRGYDPEEVRPFLEMVSLQWDELQEDVRHAKDRVRELESKIGHYEKVEEALQQALDSAKTTAQRTQIHAEERAKLILEEAELRAEQILRNAEQDRFRLRQDVSRLTHRHAEVTARLRHFLMSELEILAQHEDERPVGFMKLIPARDAESLPAAPAPGRGATPESAGEPADARRADAQKEVSSEDPGRTGENPARTGEEPWHFRGEPVAPAMAAEQAHPPPEGPTQGRSDESEEDRSGTTYADLYARAASRAPRSEQPGDEDYSAVDDEEETPSWNLRQIVADQDENRHNAEGEPTHTERDQIRRIIEDLD